MLTAKISDCEGTSYVFNAWSPTTYVEEIFKAETKLGVLLIGGRYKVDRSRSLSVQLGSGLISGFSWEAPPAVFKKLVTPHLDYDLSTDRTITTLATHFEDFNQAYEAYLENEKHYLYVTTEAKLTGLSQHTFLQKKRRADGELNFNSFVTFQDENNKFQDMYAPVDVLCNLAGVSLQLERGRCT